MRALAGSAAPECRLQRKEEPTEVRLPFRRFRRFRPRAAANGLQSADRRGALALGPCCRLAVIRPARLQSLRAMATRIVFAGGQSVKVVAPGFAVVWSSAAGGGWFSVRELADGPQILVNAANVLYVVEEGPDDKGGTDEPSAKT